MKIVKYIYLLGRLPLLPWSHLGQNLGPQGRLFHPSQPLAYSLFVCFLKKQQNLKCCLVIVSTVVCHISGSPQ